MAGKKVVCVILDQFADWEGAYISNALLGGEITQGNEVIWASTDREPKRSIGGMTVLPDVSLADIPLDSDALLLIGGYSWNRPEALSVVPVAEKFRESGKLLGFICGATSFAAAHGFLNEVKHTGNDPEEMKKLPGYTNPDQYLLQDAVSDGSIVTANGNSPVEFAVEILRGLQAAGEEDIAMWSDFYKIGYINAARKYGYLPPEGDR